MTYTLEISRPAFKSLKKVPKNDLRKIHRKIEKLAIDPFPNGYKKIVGDDNLFRIRSGNYRILYRIFRRRLIIYIVDVGNRKEVYSR